MNAKPPIEDGSNFIIGYAELNHISAAVIGRIIVLIGLAFGVRIVVRGISGMFMVLRLDLGECHTIDEQCG
jgi:hypothetical protein